MSFRLQSQLVRAVLLIAGTLLVATSGSFADSGTFRTLQEVCSKPSCHAQGPVGRLVMDSTGNLYGALANAEVGIHQGGAIFELSPETSTTRWKFKILYYFCSLNNCADGHGPNGSLIVDTAGNLYGTTSSGGLNNNSGTVFELTPVAGKSWTEKIVYSFCSRNSACTDGSSPFAGLTYTGQAGGAPYDGVSNLYATTFTAGKYNGGTAVILRPGKTTWTATPIYAFCAQGGAQCTDGTNPSARLLVGSTGALYGTTASGGTPNSLGQNGGAAFELSSVSGTHTWSYRVLYSFCAQPKCTDGAQPSDLVMDSSGNLFGTAASGGAATKYCSYGQCGAVFKIAPGGTETVLYSFCSKKDCKDGAFPSAGLAIDDSGNLFGATSSLGNCTRCGTMFELSGTSYSVLHAFCSRPDCSDGSDPYGGLILGSGNELFGATDYGTPPPLTGGHATIYEWTPKATP